MGGVGLYGRPPCLCMLLDVAEAGDHKGPPRTAPPPSPLRMLMGFSLTECVWEATGRGRPASYGFAATGRLPDEDDVVQAELFDQLREVVRVRVQVVAVPRLARAAAAAPIVGDRTQAVGAEEVRSLTLRQSVIEDVPLPAPRWRRRLETPGEGCDPRWAPGGARGAR